MHNFPKVSVIIPVFQAISYIEKTLACLQNQTLKELEFIFVDDKGGDGAFEVVKVAAAGDPRIVCLENEVNSGPGVSRNKAIEAARGEFIAFVDADDILSPDFYEKLYIKAKDTGALVVKSGVFKITEDGRYVKSPHNERIIRELKNSPESMLNLWYCEHWGGIYSRDLVMKTGARNCESARRDQDTCFQMMLMIHVRPEQFAMEESVSYYYVQQPNSLVHKPKDAYYLEQMRLSGEFKINFMLQQPPTPENTHYLADLLNSRISWHGLDPAIKGIASVNDMIQYIDYFTNVLKREPFSDIALNKYPALQLIKTLNYDSATYLAFRLKNVRSKKANDLYMSIKRLEYCVSLLARRQKLVKQYQKLRFKIIFSFGKRRKHLKEMKAAIKSQLSLLKRL